MSKYWEITNKIPNTENQKVINEFLLRLKNTDRSKGTITGYRVTLQFFFKETKVPFSSLTSKDIQQWFMEHQKDWKENRIRQHSVALRSFFSFCIEEGYMEKSPIKNKRKEDGMTEPYWEVVIPLPNHVNQKVINEFLLSLKGANRSKSTVIQNRHGLQFFFKEREGLFSSLTSDDFQKWLTEHQKDWKGSTKRGYVWILRSFYTFCVEEGYMKESPIHIQRKGERYWVIQVPFCNDANQAAVSEFLLSLKVANNSKHTINNYRYFLQTFFKDRKELFSNLTSGHIQEWLNQYGKEWKEKTLMHHLNALKSFYAFSVEEGHLEKSPIKSRWFPRLPKPVPKYLDKEEVAKLRQQGEKELLRNRVLVEFLLTSGCRIGEVHQLNRADVDVENRTAIVLGKGKKIRHIHFSEKSALLLEKYLESRKDDNPALFVTNGKGKKKRLSIRWMGTIVNRMGKGTGISGSLHPHRLRHTFATELLAKGAELSFIGDELGHADLKTTQVYANLPKSKIISMYRKYMG